MKRFGLLGYPLIHSGSPHYFTEKFLKEGIVNASYELFPVADLSRFRDWLNEQDEISGLNVTIPYKTSILPLLDELDPLANDIGAVNTVTISRKTGNLWLKGFNTDVYGFLNSLPKPLNHSHALVLGTGGASRAVTYVLKHLGIRFLFVSRQPNPPLTIGYREITRKIIREYTLIINTTPLGMVPDFQFLPAIPYEWIDDHHFLYDLIYNPPETAFLAKGKRKHAHIQNGISMLYLQAEQAFNIFFPTTSAPSSGDPHL